MKFTVAAVKTKGLFVFTIDSFIISSIVYSHTTNRIKYIYIFTFVNHRIL